MYVGLSQVKAFVGHEPKTIKPQGFVLLFFGDSVMGSNFLLVDHTRIGTGKDVTAFFVNIGRGKTVDTGALVRALGEGSIGGAALDVTDPEPLPAAHELWGMPNVIITPHVGGDSERHMERIWLLFRENLRRFAAGEPLLSVVDKRRGY